MASVPSDLPAYCKTLAETARDASRRLAVVSGQTKQDALTRAAALLRERRQQLLDANAVDLAAALDYGLSTAAVDRLRLDAKRIDGMAKAVEDVAALPDPVGEVIEGHVRPNGLLIERVRVPLGVILFIYESRPNVTADAAALCLRSGNAVILRGGKEALHSNRAIHAVMAEALDAVGLPETAAQIVTTTDHAAVTHLLHQEGLIDVVIPRGGEGLIRAVTQESRIPVIKHYNGICHVYVDRWADPDMAETVALNAKVQRPGVCNAMETLLVHREVADALLPRLAARLREAGVELRGCERTCGIVPDCVAATEEDWSTEYLALILSIKVVDSVSDAVYHISRYGSQHTDAIVTEHLGTAKAFVAGVDSSSVMVNASTRFSDGGEYGMGAEIGISTGKLHARGPCGLRELTTYKFVVHGSGQIRT